MTDIAQGASCACGPYKKEKKKFEKFMTSPWTKLGFSIVCIASPLISFATSVSLLLSDFAKIINEKLPLKKAIKVGKKSTLFFVASGAMLGWTVHAVNQKKVFAEMEINLAGKMLENPLTLSISDQATATYPRLLGFTWHKTGTVEMSITGAHGEKTLDNGCKPFRFTTSRGGNFVAYYTRTQNGSAIKCAEPK